MASRGAIPFVRLTFKVRRVGKGVWADSLLPSGLTHHHRPYRPTLGEGTYG